ncbi:hypothetical protein Taro_040850 [Colocasia esculenta]|uniref:CCHC-type domain-containing protein n=1 Tax=Colocasia esculenta TaxID=4460 RepID=A0A843WRM5_COLES|nr:hypothetical protein [Colocasia esculenta]
MLSRRLQWILAKKKKYQSGRRYFKKGKDFKKPEAKDIKKNEPICYECKKPGHIKAECPKLKKSEFRKKDSSRKFRRYKKKAMAAAWDNSSDSDSESSSNSEEEEKANLAFMADIAEKSVLSFSAIMAPLNSKSHSFNVLEIYAATIHISSSSSSFCLRRYPIDSGIDFLGFQASNLFPPEIS